MSKLFYFSMLSVGLTVFVYFYILNFDNMSETDLVSYATLWYIPLVFGLYGLYALRIQKKVSAEDTNALRFIFFRKRR